MYKFLLLHLVWLPALLCIGRTNAQEAQRTIDSLKTQVTKASDEKFLNSCFLIADNYMEIDQYDSAQAWLNKISDKIPAREPSLSNYFLLSRQAEVYYYNGLQRLGLQEAERALEMAKALHDSLLLADAYNFLGLFYTNLDSNRKAISYFRKGIEFIQQPPYPEKYLSLSMPYHLHGNLAEAYEKAGMKDSAIYHNRISLILATKFKSRRGIAVAHSNMATTFLNANNADSALKHFAASKELATDGHDIDVELIDYGGLARAEDLLGHRQASTEYLENGLLLINKNPSVNNLFAGQFFDDAIYLFKKFDDKAMLATLLEKKSQLLQKQIVDNNRQVNSILASGMKNETRLLNLEVKDAKQRNEISNIRVYLLLACVAVLLAIFLLYRYNSKQKLQMFELQNKISQDLHDDVGSSLSSLQVYSSVASQLMEEQPAKAKEMLRKISTQSATLMENIGDIVWSMKPENEQALSERIKNFVSDVLGAANINYQVVIEDGTEAMIRNIAARKNILLIVKEAINNATKYSHANRIAVNIKKLGGQLCLMITDDGVGIQPSLSEKKAVGLANMKKRTEELGGIFTINTATGKGTTISALFPLTTISDTA